MVPASKAGGGSPASGVGTLSDDEQAEHAARRKRRWLRIVVKIPINHGLASVVESATAAGAAIAITPRSRGVATRAYGVLKRRPLWFGITSCNIVPVIWFRLPGGAVAQYNRTLTPETSHENSVYGMDISWRACPWGLCDYAGSTKLRGSFDVTVETRL
jgi:hypothetical protein